MAVIPCHCPTEYGYTGAGGTIIIRPLDLMVRNRQVCEKGYLELKRLIPPFDNKLGFKNDDTITTY